MHTDPDLRQSSGSAHPVSTCITPNGRNRGEQCLQLIQIDADDLLTESISVKFAGCDAAADGVRVDTDEGSSLLNGTGPGWESSPSHSEAFRVVPGAIRMPEQMFFARASDALVDPSPHPLF